MKWGRGAGGMEMVGQGCETNSLNSRVNEGLIILPLMNPFMYCILFPEVGPTTLSRLCREGGWRGMKPALSRGNPL